MDNFKELSFPVPWGHVAAKAWGDPCATPVLVIHGRQDNAGSFDRLIAHLPGMYYYVCLDLPGHGYSTRIPKGIPLDIMMYVNTLRRVILQLKWEEFYIMGHSLGGQLATLYAAMFPENVIKIIGLDAFPLPTIPKEKYASYNRRLLENTIALEDKLKDKSPPTYSYEEALNRLVTHRPTPITKQSAERLLPRILRQHKSGYYYSTDQRMKFHLTTPIDPDFYYFLMTFVKCPFLLVICSSTKAMIDNTEFGPHFENTFESFRKNPNFRLVFVEGNHDVHNDNPEKVAQLVTDFLTFKKSSL